MKLLRRVVKAQKEERPATGTTPQLTVKAQQAYATMNGTEAAEDWVMKDAILLRYDINCKAYWQRFRLVKQQQE